MNNPIDYWYKKYIALKECERIPKPELTVSDIERIHAFLYAVKNNKQGAFTFQRLKDEQYQEVLDRFNEVKEYEQNKEAYTHWRESHRPKLS